MTDSVRPSRSKSSADSRLPRESSPAAAKGAGETHFSPVEIEESRSPMLFAALWFGLPLLVIILIEVLHLFGH